MKFYVRNTTRQSFEFNVRLPEMPRVFSLQLHPQRTREIDFLASDQIDELIKHMEAHGAVDRSRISGSLADYTGVLFSFDKTITDDNIVAGYEAVIDNAQERSVRETTRAGLSATLTQARAGAQEVEVQVEQDRPDNKRKRMKFGLTADHAANPNVRVALPA